MKQITCLLALSTFLALDARNLQADQTNLVQEVSLQLTGLIQGTTTSNRNSVVTSTDVTTIGTRQVINAFGTALGTPYSKAAKLVIVTPIGGGTTAFQIRDGANKVDVTSFFTYEQLSGAVSSEVINIRSGRASSSDYSIGRLALADIMGYSLGLHFDVRGLALVTSTAVPGAVAVSEIGLDVSGAGDRNGALVILQGSIRIRGNTLEVVSTAPPMVN